MSVPRWVSKYSSPRHTGTGAPSNASRSTRSKNSAGEPIVTLGAPSTSASRRARSSISRVGPPPPSPYPNGISDQFDHAASRKRATDATHSRRRQLGVVRVDRWEVGEHASAVEPLPPERVVREAVGRVPRQLLRHEPAHAARRVELRHRRRVAEHVRDPDLAAPASEPRLEVALAVHDLAGEALAGRQVHVGFDPHAADGDPLTAVDLDVDPLEQVGFVVLDPRVLLGLRAGEPVLGILVHQPHCRGERADALANRLAHRPQPRRVDVGVAGGDDAMAWSTGRACAAPEPAPPGRRRRRGTRRALAPASAAAAGGVDRRGPACASARRARRCRAPAPPPRCRSAPGRRGGSGRADAHRRSPASPDRRGRTAGTTDSMPLRRVIVTGPGVASTAYRVRRGWMPCTGLPRSSTTSASHWKPGGSARNPRSMIASTR